MENELEVPKPSFMGGGTWKLKKLTPITVIFGKNGSGKSLLLRSIRDKKPENYHYVVPERAGELGFPAEMVNQQLDPNQRAKISRENVSPNYRQAAYTRIQSLIQKRGASREKSIPDFLTPIEDEIKELLPDFILKITGGNPPFILTRDGEAISSNNQLSSGEVQVLTLSLDLLSMCGIWKFDKHEGVFLIDEPDSHIHPDLQQKLAKFLVRLYENFNFPLLISTHSTTLLAALGQHGDQKTSVIYLENKPELHATQFNDVLKKITTCLGGHALMGPLFNFPLLLVEGDDDYKIWSEVPRYSNVQISAIPCNGQEIYHYQKILEKLFGSILDNPSQESGYALVDSDMSKASNQNHIKFIKLSCNESENLYLTDEILKSLNTNWDEAKKKIIEKSSEYGQKADELKKVEPWNRKTVDCKSVIKQISQILDDKQLPWTYRLGKELGKSKPTGQLAEFLGSEVVKAIWK